MNWNVHMLRLVKIQAKIDRGEKLSAREIAYVKALWQRVREYVKPLVRAIEKDAGMSVSTLAARLERQEIRRRQDAAHLALRQAAVLKAKRGW